MIEVKNLTKKYGLNVAVNNLSFKVEPGKIYGFLGPNGAGKSTTMNIITGCLAATEGQVIINGYDIYEESKEARRFVGYLPEQPPLYPDMTPLEYLKFVGSAKGLSGAELQSQLEYVMDLTQITHMSNRLIKNLSKGYKQRVGIAQAIIGDPDIIILDEPTVGLDPQQIIYIRSLIKKLGEKHTVILSSHILSEISAVCDHVMIISHGKLVANDTLENISNMFNEGCTDLTIKGEREKIEAELRSIHDVLDVEFSENDDSIWDVKIFAKNDIDIRDALSEKLLKLNFPIYRINRENATLEHIYLELTGDDDDISDDAIGALTEYQTSPERDELNYSDSDEESNETPGLHTQCDNSDNEDKDDDDYTSLFS